MRSRDERKAGTCLGQCRMPVSAAEGGLVTKSAQMESESILDHLL